MFDYQQVSDKRTDRNYPGSFSHLPICGNIASWISCWKITLSLTSAKIKDQWFFMNWTGLKVRLKDMSAASLSPRRSSTRSVLNHLASSSVVVVIIIIIIILNIIILVASQSSPSSSSTTKTKFKKETNTNHQTCILDQIGSSSPYVSSRTSGRTWIHRDRIVVVNEGGKHFTTWQVSGIQIIY